MSERNQPIRVVLADDHHVMREGLRSWLEMEAGLKVVGETGDGLAAVELVERLRPDLLIVDVMMPGLDGIEVTEQVRKRVPQTRVLVLSMHSTGSMVLRALQAGASGYVLKSDTSVELVQAVHRALAGGRYLSPSQSEWMIDAMLAAACSEEDPYESLTRREREVLHLLAEGLGRSEIAERLALSPRTIETHRANVMRKLEFRTPAELVRYAVQRGLIPLE